MRLVVAGAAGFIGSHVCDRLIAEGHSVIGIDNFITGREDNLAGLTNEPRFELVRADVSEPRRIDGVDGVLHLASPASPVDYLDHPIATLKAGSYATHNLLEVAKANGARFFLASTSEVYGDPEVHPQPESYLGNVSSVGPRSVYDEAKRYAEACTMAYHRHYGVDVRIARIFNTYGPRMQPNDGRVVTNFVVQALTGAPLTVYGDGSQTRSFCYVDDEVEGLYRLFMRGDYEPMNVGSPAEFTVQQLADMVIEMTGSASVVERKPLPKDDPKVRRPDISRARRILGWEPTIPLREGLERTIAFFKGLPPERLASRPQPKSAFVA
ncbi:MAG TPA: UDP-glucuronic acid decarboxylase family protein [Gemmatimonadaceae bacterium]|nr:UDP-glucuronic acid decarboxylase family protein [Gemmatimonadaceae bacterium]